MPSPIISPKVLIVLAFAAIYLIWGTTYLVILVGLEDFPPHLMASIRFIIAGFMMVGFCFYKGDKVPNKKTLIKNVILGIIILSGGQGILIWAEQFIPSGYAAVLVATLPFWFVIIDKKQWSACFSNPYIIVGVVSGFVGILLLFQDYLQFETLTDKDKMHIIASIAVLIASVLWVGGSLYHRYRPAPGSIYSNLGYQLLGGAVFSFLVSLSLGEFRNFSFASVSWESWTAVLYLSVFGSIIAFVAYTWLLTKKPSALVGTYAYINPVVAVFLGWLLANETISQTQFIGMMIILGSAILVNLSRNKIQKEKMSA